MASEIVNIDEKISYLYVEHARIHVDDSAILILKNNTRTAIPSYKISCLILGPGTSITHAAIEAIQNSGTLICWEGEHMRTFYAYGMEESRK